ncbi:hypothetical protein OFN49_37855, partial [Escherichia coli]|nr:hypothetical protein [Escherichia coli]
MAVNADGTSDKLIIILWLFSKYFAHGIRRYDLRRANIEYCCLKRQLFLRIKKRSRERALEHHKT